MKDHLERLVATQETVSLKICVAREYLQARMLQILQESGVFMRWAFLGGTALRFLYAMPRYSEDLDFSLAPGKSESGFRKAIERIKRALEAENYPVNVRINDSKTVASAFVNFSGLLHELRLSPHRSQALSIKLELDTNPPTGAHIATTVVRRHVTMNLAHYDQASLLAGKLHAVLSRSYTKGRDLYDLIWYLSDRSWPEPNLLLLNAALHQTHAPLAALTSRTWRRIVRKRLSDLDWKRARDDVFPFLERERDVELISKETAFSLLENRD